MYLFVFCVPDHDLQVTLQMAVDLVGLDPVHAVVFELKDYRCKSSDE